MDDATAIGLSAGGDREAFRCLVERYEGQAYAHALAITRDRASAQDAVQEAFLDAWRAIARFDAARRFYPWLYTLLRNRCFKALAVRRPPDGPQAVGLLRAPEGQRPESTLDLERALARLAPEERELLLLKHLDGLSYEELAERTGLAAGTVMSRLFAVRRRVKALLDETPRRETLRDEARRPDATGKEDAP